MTAEAAQPQHDAQALRLSEARLRAILDASVDSVITVDAQGLVMEINSAASATLGFSRENLLGKRLPAFLLAGSEPQTLISYIAHLDPAVFRQPMELKAVAAGGILIPIELTVTPLMMEEGTQLFVGYIHDLREREAREELVSKGREWERENDYIHATTRLKNEFVANMSHELRTPLNAILGFAQLLFDGRVGEVTDQQREYLGDIIAGGRNLLLVIDDVLDWSKVEAGKLEFRAEAVDVEATVLEVCASLQALAGAKRIGVEIEIDAALGSVVTDRSALKQVLYKYLSNAIKFTDSGGRTIIRVLREGDRMFRVEVEDTGIGIAQENLGKLFVEFQQLDTSESKKYPGTGLGLALTKRLVEAQGGRVGLSTVLGQGSTFFALLPNAANSSK